MTTREQIAQGIDDSVTVYMRRTGTTQADMAALLSLSSLQFSRKRKGKAEWKMSELVTLSEIVGKSVSDLVSV